MTSYDNDKHLFFFSRNVWKNNNKYQNGIKTKRWFSAVNMTFISYSVITIATDDLAMQGAGTHFSCE